MINESRDNLDIANIYADIASFMTLSCLYNVTFNIDHILPHLLMDQQVCLDLMKLLLNFVSMESMFKPLKRVNHFISP